LRKKKRYKSALKVTCDEPTKNKKLVEDEKNAKLMLLMLLKSWDEIPKAFKTEQKK
jgi:hypothetical protein